MFPAFTSCPPNNLTPKRLDMESRPLLVLPPAFLCATVRPWSRVSLAFNTSDFHFGEALAVALSFLKMFTSVEFNDFYLVAAALF